MDENVRTVLVCYATGTGCTEGVAECIGTTIARTGVRVDVRPFDASLDPAGYDAVVAGSGLGDRSRNEPPIISIAASPAQNRFTASPQPARR